MSERQPYPSLEAMLDPGELSGLLGRPVVSVSVEHVQDAETSTEAEFQRVTLDGDDDPSLFIKRVDPSKDWVALGTEDLARRAVTMWSLGVFDRMPRQVDPGVIACASWDEGYAVLMPDVSARLTVPGARMSVAQGDALLAAMAALHAAFWDDTRLADSALGLCAPGLFLSHTSPQRATELRRQIRSFVFDAIEAGWDALPAFIDPGLVRELEILNDDPTPIVAALAASPRTLVHSDIRPANLGLGEGHDGGAKVVLLDWGRPVFTAPTVDLGYYLGWTAVERPTDVDTAIAVYEARLRARLRTPLDADAWEAEREIGILGGVLNTLCFHALAAGGDDAAAATERAALVFWAARLRSTIGLL